MEFLDKQRLFSKVNLMIAALTVFCFALLAFRIGYSGTTHFRFLVWNLFLALIPLGITHIVFGNKTAPGKLAMAIALGAWLLFFPNAPYILTDLFHLKPHSSMPIWFDLVLILSFAWTGLLAGFISLMRIEEALKLWFSPRWTAVGITLLLFLGSFGIYLGRFLRWNSWDIMNRPGALFGDIVDRFAHPFDHPRTWGVTIFLGLMLTAMYFSLRLFRSGNRQEPF
jgi:uncharacterized membrane protein